MISLCFSNINVLLSRPVDAKTVAESAWCKIVSCKLKLNKCIVFCTALLKNFGYMVHSLLFVAVCYDISLFIHDDVIKWKHFLRYWPLVRGIHRTPVRVPLTRSNKGQWCGSVVFFFYLWLNKRLSKQSRHRWLEAPLQSLWHHSNALSARITSLALKLLYNCPSVSEATLTNWGKWGT